MVKRFSSRFKRVWGLAVVAAWAFSSSGMPGQRTLAYAAEAVAAVSQDALANTENGRVRGFATDGVNYYRGIPYAKPPVGELRWQPPVNSEPWQGVLDATQYKSEAAQTDFLGVFATPGGSEDCLYLNVAVPEKQPGDPEKLLSLIHI